MENTEKNLRIKRFLEFVGLLGAVLFAVLAAGSLVLDRLLPSNAVKTAFIGEFTHGLGREVQVDDVSIGLFSGVTFSGIRISEKPDFSQGTLLAAERLTFRMALLPLFARRVIVKEVVLRRPILEVRTDADGRTLNVWDLVQTKRDSEPPKPITLLISQARVQQGAIRFQPQVPGGPWVHVDGLNLKISDLHWLGPCRASAVFKARSKDQTVSFWISGKLDFSKIPARVEARLTFKRRGKMVSPETIRSARQRVHGSLPLLWQIIEDRLNDL